MRTPRRLPSVAISVLLGASMVVGLPSPAPAAAPVIAAPAATPNPVAPTSDPVPGPVSYAYDAAGRLVGVVAADGSIARYVYDATGNVLSVDRLGIPAVAVLSAIPSRVRPGDTITVSGKGFGATPAANTVTVNTTAATVITSTTERLTVTVPAGATSGDLRVTTAAGTATLPGITVIGNDQPVITDFTPKIAAVGTSITLTVANPDPEYANNLVRVNNLLAGVTARAAGSLTINVPPGVGSGYVQLATPAGTATSSAVLVVPPAGTPVANVDTAAEIPVGTAAQVPVAAGKFAVRYFPANDGDRFAVALTSGTFGFCGLDASSFDEHNRQVGQAGCVGSSGWIETGPVSGPGLRSILLHNTTGSAGTTGVTVYRVPPDVDAGTQALDGTAKTFTINNPGQNAFSTFAGAANQRVIIQSTNTSGVFSCCGLSWWLTAPDGTRVGNTQSPNSTLDTITLPQNGLYRITVDPNTSLVGSTTITAWDVPPDLDAGTQTLDGVGKTVTITNPGRNAFTSFSGTSGQRVIIQSSNTSGVFSCCGLSWWLAAPDGTRVGNTQSPNSTLNTIALPQTGIYRIVVDPSSTLTGSTTLQAWDVPPDLDAGTQTLDGVGKTITVANPGQNASTSFNGTTGQRVILQSSNTSGVFSCCGMTWWITAPDGTTRVGNTQSPNSTLDTIALPQTGLYRIWFDPNGTLVGSTTITAWDVPPDFDAGAQTLDGVGKTITVNNPGQNAFTSFSGTTGQRVILQSSNTSAVFSCCGMTWWITAPDGTTRVGNTQSPNSTLDTIALPQTGTYRIWFNPNAALIGSTTITAWDVPPDFDAGAQTLDGVGKTITVNNPGQNAFTSFSGTTGQRVILQSSNTSAVFSCCGMTWWITAPNGAQVGNTQSPNSTLDTIVLPQTGIYKINFNPNSTLTGSTTITAWDVPPDLDAGGQTLDGVGKTITISNPGQNAFSTFSGTTGQRVILQSSNTSAVFSCCGMTWWITAPNGAQVGNTQSPNSTLDTIVLPQTGTYKINFNPNSTLTGATTITAWDVPPDLDAGTQALDGTPKTITIDNPGRNAFSTFSGTTNQRVIIQSSNTSAVFSCCGMSWWLTAPNGAQVGNTQSPNSTLDTIVLPQTGTYKINFNPNSTLTGSTTLTAWDVPANLDAGGFTINGAAKTITIGNPGQDGFASFTGSSGQVVTIQSSNSSPAFGCCGLTWWVLGPTGSQVGSTRSPNQSLGITLPQAGTYKVMMSPNGTLIGASTFAATATGFAKTVSASATVAPSTAAAPDPATRALHKLEPDGIAPQWNPPDGRIGAPNSANAATVVVPADQARTADWSPDQLNLAGADWLTRRPATGQVTDLVAPNGVTAVSGHVYDLNGKPLAGIPVRMDAVQTTTDTQGRFLLAKVRDNASMIIVDGYAANTAPARYGTFRIHATVHTGVTTPLDATVWLPRLDMKHAQQVGAPTKQETVLTTPDIPGLEVHIPAGSVVRDLNGAVVDQLGITAIPLDRPPYPLPRNGIVPIFFTVQPGGSAIFPDGATVVYPNYTHLPPGMVVDFWNYDPQQKGWYVYGHGTVSKDGTQVVPDEHTKLWTLDGAMFNGPGNPKPDNNWLDDLIDALSGDPVDLSTGLMTDAHTDLGLTDLMPITVNRMYWQGDNHAREYGVNSGTDFNMYLRSEVQYQEVDLYSAGGAKTHFVRTSPGTGFGDAVFASATMTGRWAGSTIASAGTDWIMTTRDGTKFYFPWFSRVRMIQDRNGNQITFLRSGGDNGEVSQVISPSGRWISYEYDATARVTRAFDNIGRSVGYTYDAAGRLATVTDVAGHTSTYTYDTANRITRITDARGVSYLDVSYDANGRVARQTLADGGTYAFDYTVNGSGVITETRVTQPSGSVRRVVFDANRMITSDTQAYGTPLARTTTFVRGAGNRLDSVIDPFGRRTDYGYDGATRVTSVTELAGTPDAFVDGQVSYGPFDQPLTTTDAAGKITSYGYDSRGNLTGITDPLSRTTTMTRTAAGQVASVKNPASAVTTFTYEGGVPVSARDPLGRTATVFADAAGRPVLRRDPSGAATLTQYDAQNQPVRITDPLGGVTQYGYDEGGNLTSFTDARGKVTHWAYDGQNRATTRTDPLGHTSTVSYDGAGRVTASVSRAGVRTETGYDALNRPTTTRFGVSGGTEQSHVDYAYGAADLLTALTDSTGGTVGYGYDVRGQLTSVTSPNGTVGYGYDAVGRQVSTSVPGLPDATYSYNAAGQLSGVTRGGDTVSLTRDAVGRPTTVSLPGGWTQTYAYDPAGQITGITYAQGGTDKGGLGYGYDASGRRISVTGSLANVSLPSARSGLAYDDANRLQGLGYDADGNLLNDGTTGYTWNARAQLVGTSSAAVSGTYTYDASGYRTSRTVGGATTKFLYDGANVAAEQDATGALTGSLLGGAPDQWFARGEAGTTDTLLTDALGSPVALGRSDGTLTASQAYDPFGLPSVSGDRRHSDLSFTGRQDDGTGLLQYRDRYYSPGLQRFVSEDPIGLSGGTNLYGYVADSPANLTDPSGHNPLLGCAIGAAIGAGLDYGMQRLSGRKVDWGMGGVGGAALGGCAIGALGGLLGGLGRGAAAAEEAMPAFPQALTAGRNAEAGVEVYQGMRNGEAVYSGITNNLERRAAEHAGRDFDYLRSLTQESGAVTRGEARAIEQAMIERSQGENLINSISPNQPYYQQAVDWGRAWLTRNGF